MAISPTTFTLSIFLTALMLADVIALKSRSENGTAESKHENTVDDPEAVAAMVDIYARASSLAAKPSSLVATLTSEAGVLHCRKGIRC